MGAPLAKATMRGRGGEPVPERLLLPVQLPLQGLDLQAASDQVIGDELTAMGGDGGIVALAPGGEIAWSFNTPGMYRARLSEGGEPVVAIYGDED